MQTFDDPSDASTIARVGRPRADRAGEVDTRILDAATRLFLLRGFDATSCDQVAAEAKAGKASLYARHAGKDALFEAVVRRMVATSFLPPADAAAAGDAASRLRAVGLGMLRNSLSAEAVALMRVVVGASHRFPELARAVYAIGREGGRHRVADALSGETTTPDHRARALGVADRFLDLTCVPQQMRALIGDSPETLERDAPGRVDAAVALLAGAGLLDGFDPD